MAIPQQILKGLQEGLKTAYVAGGKQVLKQFAPVAGRELQKGNGATMKVFNEVSRALSKMK